MKKWIILIIGLLGIDQLTKYIVFTNKIMDQAIIKDVLHIQYTKNYGLVFGMFQGATTSHTILLAGFAVLALGVFGFMLYKNDFKDKRTKWYALALSLLIAGTLGNAIDRLFQADNGVIDFIAFIAFPQVWNFPFNFADAFLNVGLVLLFIDVFFLEKKRQTNKSQENHESGN